MPQLLPAIAPLGLEAMLGSAALPIAGMAPAMATPIASAMAAPMLGMALPAAAAATGAGLGLGSLVTPGLLGAGSVGASMIQGQQAKKSAEKAQTGALGTWQQTAYPSAAAVQAAGTEQRGALGQARLGAYQNLASQLAARGFGPSSGLMGREAASIERGYLQGLGKIGTELTKFQETPMWGPPSQAYPTPVSGALEAGLGKTSNIMDTAMGYYLMNQLLRG